MLKGVRWLSNTYGKLPIKPFKGVLSTLYSRYTISNKGEIIVATVDGITYQLDLNQLIDNAIYYQGCFEPMTTAIIDKYVKQGMTVLDIGANIGCHTLRMAKLVGDNGRVIAFEPMSWALSKCKINIGLNNYKNITIESLALSDANQRKPASFRSSWALDGLPERNENEDVLFSTLDDYVKRTKLGRVNFVKLDVDGYEYKVLRGGLQTIRRYMPIMVIELGKYTLNNVGDNLEDVLDLLESIGYSFYSEKNLRQYHSKSVLMDAVPADATINVVCK